MGRITAGGGVDIKITMFIVHLINYFIKYIQKPGDTYENKDYFILVRKQKNIHFYRFVLSILSL